MVSNKLYLILQIRLAVLELGNLMIIAIEEDVIVNDNPTVVNAVVEESREVGKQDEEVENSETAEEVDSFHDIEATNKVSSC